MIVKSYKNSSILEVGTRGSNERFPPLESRHEPRYCPSTERFECE